MKWSHFDFLSAQATFFHLFLLIDDTYIILSQLLGSDSGMAITSFVDRTVVATVHHYLLRGFG